MPRPIFDEARTHPAIRDALASYGTAIISEVREAIAGNAVVVVGMAQNPFPRRARRLLDARGIAYRYLEYGSYLSQWRLRLALKMWTGWPTFPMIFVRGTFVGGAGDLEKLLANGGFDALLSGQ